jgi:hypothetical protein
MAKVSPTQRSLKYWKGLYTYVAKTEHWNAFAKVRQDLFGFADLVVLRLATKGVLAVQTTSAKNISAREKKIQDLPAAKAWLESGNQIIVEGWSKKGPRGGKKVWTRTEKQITEIP